jgi:hypothetical protein
MSRRRRAVGRPLSYSVEDPERLCEAEYDSAFDLLPRQFWIDQPPAIDHCRNPFDLHSRLARCVAVAMKAIWLPYIEWQASPLPLARCATIPTRKCGNAGQAARQTGLADEHLHAVRQVARRPLMRPVR